MDKTFTPITILLIEDNPAQEGIKAKDLKSRKIDIGDLDDNIDVPGINFKKEKNKELYNLFTLKVLQHPEEIKEYVTNCLKKEDVEGSVALGKIAGVVPEIVEFDYKLYDNIEINSESDNQIKKHIKYWSSYKKLREHYNPNFLFKGEQHLEKKENENYVIKDFIERINYKSSTKGNEVWYKKDETDLTVRDDELGLYAGVEITRIFRNHVCIGIPATFNFDVRERLHVFGKFYEWVNEYDLGTMFSREERGNKDWDSVIAAAVKQLRIRIETQLQSDKISLNLTQLLKYAEDIPAEQKERIFTLQSVYGVRHFPLDGLFIDLDSEMRNEAIKEWIKGKEGDKPSRGLLGMIVSSLPLLKDTIKSYESIYGTYRNQFLNRILLSDFSKRQKEDSLGGYSELYDKLKKEFGVTAEGKISESCLCSVEQVFADKKGKKKDSWSGDDVSKLRLLVLLLCTRLWIDHQRGQKKQADNIPLIREDYFYVLNPVMNTAKGDNPLLLCMHSDISEADYVDSFQKFLGRSPASIPESSWNTFNWITAGEKKIIKSQFQSELSVIERQPSWLS